MKVLQRYFVDEVTRSVLFVLLAFLSLFSFYDLTGELKSIGRGGYQLHHAFSYVLLGVPGRVYELMPTAALIGTIWALAQFASRSEFTIMRVSGMSTARAGWMLGKIGLAFVFITFLFGEVLSPIASEAAEKLKLRAQGASLSQEFRSGLWAKDVVKSNGLSGDPIGTRFLNVQEVRADGELRNMKLYEFDRDFRLTALVTAAHAHYRGNHVWRLSDVSITHFPDKLVATGARSLYPAPDLTAVVSSTTMPSRDLVSEITPQILSVLFADPDRMSAYSLLTYTRHLAENKQDTPRYEIAFWKKLIYPFAVLVMMALALPFAYLHVRAGGVSLKIFIGIMIGVSFELLNGLFSHLGLLNTWPPLATALLPSAVFLLLALAALWRVERR
jgi:lipopolysaccharide export system permease protein